MLLAQFSPGPDMLLLLRNALGHPVRTGLSTVLGIACGLSVHMGIVLTGLGVAIKNSRVLYPVLLIVGACWLGRLSFSLLKSAWAMPAGRAADKPAGSPPADNPRPQSGPMADKAAFIQGLVTNLSNVKAILFLGTVVLAWLGNGPGPGRKAAAFAIVIGQSVFFWSLFVLALQHRRVRSLWETLQRPLTGVFGVCLLLLALDAARQGIILLRH